MENKKFLIASFSPLPEAIIKSFITPYLNEINADIEVINLYNADINKILKILEDADIVIGDHTFKMKITKEMCNAMRKVRLIQQPSTGFG
jgi:glyoxylate reductase